ncbi:MAG: type II toxin-antitoxin system RelE/ParE family toxin [Ginsengibacter sp.]
MAYKIIVSPRAQREIEDAIDFYSLDSVIAPKQFINFLQYAYKSLEMSPFFKVRYKNIRALKIKRFPYSLYFVIKKVILLKYLAVFITKEILIKDQKIKQQHL